MSNRPHLFFENADYDGQFGRTLAAAAVGAADLGEAFAVARDVGDPDPSRWHTAWSARADAVRTVAAKAAGAGDVVTARSAYLRASEYQRQAIYFVRHDLDDPRLTASYRDHVETFQQATSLMDHPAEQVRIPYDGTTLKGYLFAPDASGARRPTMLMPCGYDSTAEAGWYAVPSALERGYNALVFEGPGQGEALYDQRLWFRPDFEHVLTPVVDWLVERPEVDADGLVLHGRSFGGYLAPRAATVEHRLAALICDPAQPDMAAHLPQGLVGRVAVPVVELQSHFDGDKAEFFGARMVAHGLHDVGDYFQELHRYTMLPQAGQITCPTLIIECEGDPVGGGGQALLDALRCPAHLVELTAAEGAGGHCAGIGQRVWDDTVYPWIADVLRAAR